MFREYRDHIQGSLFETSNFMNSKISEKLKKTWAPLFYEHVFCQIDEKPFAILYCEDNGRPNTPVNMLLSLEFIKHFKGYTDEELLEQFCFNYQVSYAVGQRCLGEFHIAPRTLYDFRERIYRYALENQGQEDLIFQQFDDLTAHFIEVLKLNTLEQRTDSTQIMPHIKWAGRLALAYDVLVQAVKACPSDILTQELQSVLETRYKTDLLYRTKSSETKGKLESILLLLQHLLDRLKPHSYLLEKEEIQLLKRFLTEQAHWDESKWKAKENKEISSRSLQSAYDPDATYREKGGKKYKGYVANLTETCSQDNPVQLLTDYHLAPNTTSDIELLQNRLPEIKERMPLEDLYADGGYYGEEALKTAKETEVNLHFTNMTGRKRSSDKLPITSFSFDDKERITTCPMGHAPLRSDLSKREDSISAHFERQLCEQCPNKDRCPVQLQKKDAVVRISKKSLLAAKARGDLADSEKRLEFTSKRVAIEGTNSAIKRGLDAGELDVRTMPKCQTVFGLKMIGHNFRQFVRGIAIKARQIAKSKTNSLSQGSSLSCYV
jgi:hypothetical protein